MNSVRSNSLSFKYQGFPPLGCQDIRIRKFEFVAKTQFLSCLIRIKMFEFLAWNFKPINSVCFAAEPILDNDKTYMGSSQN